MVVVCRNCLNLLLALVLFSCSLVLSGCDEDILLANNNPAGSTQQSAAVPVANSNNQHLVSETASGMEENFGASEFIRQARCEQLKVSAPQGVSCLQCTHPKAQRQGDVLTDILLSSCLKNIALSYLVDGSFGTVSEFEDFLKSQIEKLARNDRQLFLYLYLGNGPWQRRSGQGGLLENAPLLATLAPEEFRSRIQTDYNVQYEYQRGIIALHSVLRFASERGVQLALIPFLEDNLDNESFEMIYELTLDAVPQSVSVSILRSACRGCYPGNESAVPSGTFQDIHTASAKNVKYEDGLVTNDGTPFRFDWEEPGVAKRTLSDLRSVRNRAVELNNGFLLWSAKYQGLKWDARRRNPMENPEIRNYSIPSSEEAAEIIDFLNATP